MVAERPCKDCPVPNWKENISKLASQLFETLEFRRKLSDDILKSIFIYVAKCVVGDPSISSRIPSWQSACCQWPCLLAILSLAPAIVTTTNAHPYKDVEKRLEIVPTSVALALEHLDRHELGASPVTRTARNTVQLLP